MTTAPIRMYATAWCGDCFRARRFLDSHDISYEYIDITGNSEATHIVEETNNGSRSVPTIVFPDGSVLVEPSNGELAAKFGIT